jgi:hypothetical protein
MALDYLRSSAYKRLRGAIQAPGTKGQTMTGKRYSTRRAWLLEAAAELEPDFRQSIDGPGRYDGSSDRELTAALEVLAGVSGQDDEAGDVETGLWLARFGHYVLCADSQGFLDVERYGSDRLAQLALVERDAELDETDEL